MDPRGNGVDQDHIKTGNCAAEHERFECCGQSLSRINLGDTERNEKIPSELEYLSQAFPWNEQFVGCPNCHDRRDDECKRQVGEPIYTNFLHSKQTTTN